MSLVSAFLCWRTPRATLRPAIFLEEVFFGGPTRVLEQHHDWNNDELKLFYFLSVAFTGKALLLWEFWGDWAVGFVMFHFVCYIDDQIVYILSPLCSCCASSCSCWSWPARRAAQEAQGGR